MIIEEALKAAEYTEDYVSLLNESVAEKAIDAIDYLLNKLIELLKNLRKKIAEYRDQMCTKPINDKIKSINNPNNKSIEYKVPNKDSIKLYIDSLYIDSYNSIIDKVMMMVVNNKTLKEIKIEVFGEDVPDTYSNNNNYLYIIRNYLRSVLKKDINDREDLNKALYDAFIDKAKVNHTTTSNIASELLSSGDFNKTSLGKEVANIKDIKNWTIDYYNDAINKSLVKAAKLKHEIKKNKKEYDKDIYDIIYRVIYHYTRMLRDGNVHKGIKGISNMEDEIYNIVNNLISGKM